MVCPLLTVTWYVWQSAYNVCSEDKPRIEDRSGQNKKIKSFFGSLAELAKPGVGSFNSFLNAKINYVLFVPHLLVPFYT
jgi:hypothetical protein